MRGSTRLGTPHGKPEGRLDRRMTAEPTMASQCSTEKGKPHDCWGWMQCRRVQRSWPTCPSTRKASGRHDRRTQHKIMKARLKKKEWWVNTSTFKRVFWQLKESFAFESSSDHGMAKVLGVSSMQTSQVEEGRLDRRCTQRVPETCLLSLCCC